MNRMTCSQVAVACGVALALSSAACSKTERGKLADEARGHEGAPINLTGCLQKDPGVMTTFILTQASEPTRSVGTSGTTADEALVEQERLRAAKHAYRLDGDKDQLDALVGKQVKVSGTVAEKSDLSGKTADADHRLDLDAGDLAKVDVVTIAALGNSCGATP